MSSEAQFFLFRIIWICYALTLSSIRPILGIMLLIILLYIAFYMYCRRGSWRCYAHQISGQIIWISFAICWCCLFRSYFIWISSRVRHIQIIHLTWSLFLVEASICFVMFVFGDLSVLKYGFDLYFFDLAVWLMELLTTYLRIWLLLGIRFCKASCRSENEFCLLNI